jgi:hypothetical protein
MALFEGEVILDAITQKIVEVELTPDQILDREKSRLFTEPIRKTIADQNSLKAAAEAKLAALGLTADDLRALGL